MPYMGSRYVPNHSDMRKHMVGPEVRQAAVGAARDIAAIARATSPVSSGDDDGDHYRDHFDVDGSLVVTIKDGPYPNPRAAAAVVNDSEYAAQVEFGDPEKRGRPQGGTHGQPQRVLGRIGATFGDYRGGPPA